jgi:hypothetical protein
MTDLYAALDCGLLDLASGANYLREAPGQCVEAIEASRLCKSVTGDMQRRLPCQSCLARDEAALAAAREALEQTV